MVLAAQNDRPDGTLHCVGIMLFPAIVEVAAESLQRDQGISDGIGESTAWRHSMQFSL